jgi:hypothetical protein
MFQISTEACCLSDTDSNSDCGNHLFGMFTTWPLFQGSSSESDWYCTNSVLVVGHNSFSPSDEI